MREFNKANSTDENINGQELNNFIAAYQFASQPHKNSSFNLIIRFLGKMIVF